MNGVPGHVVIYAHGLHSHAEAAAGDIRNRYPGARLIAVLNGPPEETPAWADLVCNPAGLKRLLQKEGIGRPGLLVLLVSNDPRFTGLGGLAGTLWRSLSVLPRRFDVWLYAWSGRFGLAEAAGEVFRKFSGMIARPFQIVMFRSVYLLGELLFPLINGKLRNKTFGSGRVRRVLVLSLDLIGDMVWLSPAVSELGRLLPEARIDMLVSSSNAGMAAMVDGVDDVIKYDAPWFGKLRSPKGAPVKSISRLRNLAVRLGLITNGYDLVLDFRGEPRDYVLMYFTGAPYRAGFMGEPSGPIQKDDVSYMLTHRYSLPVSERDRTHLVDRHIGMLRSLGLDARAAGGWINPGKEHDEAAGRMLQGAGVNPGDIVVCMQPGASRTEKCWNRDGFAEVARSLIEAGARVLLLGSKDEEPLCTYISENAPGAVSLCGRTGLGEFVAIIKASSLVITNDTSAISIASAVGTPVVCMVAVNTAMLGPYGVKSAVLQNKPLCWEPAGEHCFCPYGYRCLQEIKPAEVREAAFGMLGLKTGG